MASLASYLVAQGGNQVELLYFSDINVTLNFVANAPALLGWDPTPRFADSIVRVATSQARKVASGADHRPDWSPPTACR